MGCTSVFVCTRKNRERRFVLLGSSRQMMQAHDIFATSRKISQTRFQHKQTMWEQSVDQHCALCQLFGSISKSTGLQDWGYNTIANAGDSLTCTRYGLTKLSFFISWSESGEECRSYGESDPLQNMSKESFHVPNPTWSVRFSPGFGGSVATFCDTQKPQLQQLRQLRC